MSTMHNETTTQGDSMSLRQRIKYLLGNITVEPMLACYIMPSVLAMLATQNLNLEKACRVNLHYDDAVCAALTARDTANYTTEETQVQQLVAEMHIWKTIVQSSLPCMLILFLGSWSDRHGRRKPCMLLPIVGEFMTSVGLILCTYFFYEWPMEVAGLVESLFPAITGGWFSMFMAVFSYMADVTTVETRTMRIGFVNLVASIGDPAGMALSGILYALIGFYGVFTLSSILYVIGFLYGLRIPETPKRSQQPVVVNRKKCGFFRDFFNIRHVLETFRVAFRGGKNNRRMRIIMLMIVYVVVIGPWFGEYHQIRYSIL